MVGGMKPLTTDQETIKAAVFSGQAEEAWQNSNQSAHPVY